MLSSIEMIIEKNFRKMLNTSNKDEPSSLAHDRYAIAFQDKNGKTVCHISIYVSKQMHFFIK